MGSAVPGPHCDDVTIGRVQVEQPGGEDVVGGVEDPARVKGQLLPAGCAEPVAGAQRSEAPQHRGVAPATAAACLDDEIVLELDRVEVLAATGSDG